MARSGGLDPQEHRQTHETGIGLSARLMRNLADSKKKGKTTTPTPGDMADRLTTIFVPAHLGSSPETDAEVIVTTRLS
jgi:hypothetical protein